MNGWTSPFSLSSASSRRRSKSSVEPRSGVESPLSGTNRSQDGETLESRINAAIQYAVDYDTASEGSKGSKAEKSMTKTGSMDSAAKTGSFDSARSGSDSALQSPHGQARPHRLAGGSRLMNVARSSSRTSSPSSSARLPPGSLLSEPSSPAGGSTPRGGGVTPLSGGGGGGAPFRRAGSAGSNTSSKLPAFLRVGSDPTSESSRQSNIARASSLFSHYSSQAAAGAVGSPAQASPARAHTPPPAMSPTRLPSESVQSSINVWEDWHNTIPNGILCPLSLEIMSDPVLTCDGHTYDRVNIERWLKVNQTSPMTNAVLSNKDLVPNFALLRVISSYKSRVAGSRDSHGNAMPIADPGVGTQPGNQVRREAEEKEIVLIGKMSAEQNPHLVIESLKNGTNSLLMTRQLLWDVMSSTSPGNACAPSFCAAIAASNGIEVIEAAMRSQLQDPTVQVDGCRIFHNVCLSRGESVRALLEKDSGIVAILKAMTAHSKDPFVCLAGSTALSQLLLCEKIFSETTLERCTSCLIRVISTHETDFNVAAKSIAALKDMLPDDAIQEKIMGQGLMPVILNIMTNFEKTVKVQEEGCGLIQKISDDGQHRARIDLDRIGGLMIVAIKNFRENSQVVCLACATLKNIAIDNADVVMQLARDGGIYTILSGMGMHRRHAAVQARCLEALHACCNQNNRNCMLMHQCKGIVALMKAMTAHRFDIDVTRAGLECLDVLAESQADEHSQFTFKLCDDATVEVVTQAMRDHLESIEVQRAGCMTLCHFAFDDENEVKVVEMGGSREIVQALDAHAEDAGVVKAACSALKNMTVCHENKKIVAEEGGIGCIVDSLSMHSGDANVQEQGLWALANLAGHAPNRRLIGESMGVEVAVSALVTHIDNSHVVENGTGTLNLLSADEDNRSIILNSGGISALVNAMRKYPQKRGVQEQACYALANLSCVQDCRNDIFNEGGFELVAWTMSNFDGETKRVADVALRIFEMAGGEMAAEVKRLRSKLHLQKRVMLATSD